MDLTNMKLSRTEATELATAPCGDAPSYPYGLRLSLDDEALTKLGVTELPAIDAPLVLVARVEVCSINASASQEGGERRSMDLQITDLAIEPEPKRTDALDRLYPTMKAKA